jgi:hypothetical protein
MRPTVVVSTFLVWTWTMMVLVSTIRLGDSLGLWRLVEGARASTVLKDLFSRSPDHPPPLKTRHAKVLDYMNRLARLEVESRSRADASSSSIDLMRGLVDSLEHDVPTTTVSEVP